jgi:hypothetical protein
MDRDDVRNGAKVGRPPDYLPPPWNTPNRNIAEHPQCPQRSISKLRAAVEFAVIRFREPTIWLMQLK